MDPVTLLVVGGAATGLLALVSRKRDKVSQTQRSRDEVRRIGDATIDTMRQTSRDFREQIDRETRR
jgi:hypothetical protein